MAPPLNGSEWVTGNKNKTIAILLHGLAGPIKVRGKIYKKPNITGDMPAFGNSLSDKKVAEVANFIRKNWGNKASEVHANDVKKIRLRFSDRKKAFTPSDLNHIFGKENE
jgi:mono/diheme cytochrome c family protein